MSTLRQKEFVIESRTSGRIRVELTSPARNKDSENETEFGSVFEEELYKETQNALGYAPENASRQDIKQVLENVVFEENRISRCWYGEANPDLTLVE